MRRVIVFLAVLVVCLFSLPVDQSYAADKFDMSMGGTVTYKKSVIQLKSGAIVMVRSIGPKTGTGVSWREYRTPAGLFLGVAWNGPKQMATPNCNSLLRVLYEMLPGQLPGQKRSRFVSIIDWDNANVYGKMYLPQLFPKGFTVAELK